MLEEKKCPKCKYGTLDYCKSKTGEEVLACDECFYYERIEE